MKRVCRRQGEGGDETKDGRSPAHLAPTPDAQRVSEKLGTRIFVAAFVATLCRKQLFGLSCTSPRC